MKKTNKPRYIYGLIDPETNRICYIGLTRSPPRRLATHLSNRPPPLNDTSAQRRYQWIQGLKAQGTVPYLVILEIVEEANALQRERYWIRQIGRSGSLLVNTRNHSVNLSRLASIPDAYRQYNAIYTVRLSPALITAMKAYAKAHRLTQSELMTLAVYQYLNQEATSHFPALERTPAMPD